MIRAVIIEDDVQHQRNLGLLIEECCKEVEVIEVISSIPEAEKRVPELNPDLLFLDIELPPYTAFDLLEKTKELRFYVIFTTSFDKYSTRAFRYSAVHYLQKPIVKDDLLQAMDFYKERSDYSDTHHRKTIHALAHNVSKDASSQLVGFPTSEGVDFYTASDIVRCEADDNYTFVHVDGKKVLVTASLKRVEQLLGDSTFVRVHRSHLINVTHLQSYKRKSGASVKLKDGFVAPVSRGRTKELLTVLTDYGFLK